MYTSHFGLNENPFSIAPDPLYLYMSGHHREALAHLTYGVRTDGGFVLLTGEVGTGKTTLCRSLLEQLPENLVIAYVLNPKVSVIELLETICDELRIDRPEQGSNKQLVDRLNAYLLEANAQNRKTVLIIDEAQNLSIDVLEQLRLLTNLETNRYKLLQIILLGQPELLQILNRQEMRQLSQRVTARYHLGPLNADEVGSYIRHRLNIAGCNRPLFPDTLNKTVWQLTGGIPRLINLICDRALLGAYVLECQQVNSKILLQAGQEVFGARLTQGEGKQAPLMAGVACLSLLLLTLGLWSWKGSLSATTVIPAETLASLPTEARPVSHEQGQSLVKAETSEVARLSTESQEEPLITSWPQDLATTQSMETAFADLAGLWGLAYPADRPDYCSYAMSSGLECLARKDSLESLRSMNRPAILTLYNDVGAPFHVVIASLEQDRARFVVNGTAYEMALAVLTSRWFGEYFVLWQRPPIQQIFLKPGAQGDSVGWLAETLQELGHYTVTGHEMRLEGSLLGALKSFQLSSGLTPDGVLGPITLIHLNTVRSLDGPRLSSRGVS